MCEISSGKSRAFPWKIYNFPKSWSGTECTYSDACNLLDLLGFIGHQGSAHTKILTELLNKSPSAFPSDMQKLAVQFHGGKNNEIL